MQAKAHDKQTRPQVSDSRRRRRAGTRDQCSGPRPEQQCRHYPTKRSEIGQWEGCGPSRRPKERQQDRLAETTAQGALLAELPLRERAVAQHHLKFTFAFAFPLRKRAVAQHHFTFVFAFPLRERAVAQHHFTFALASNSRSEREQWHTSTLNSRSEREQWHNTT